MLKQEETEKIERYIDGKADDKEKAWVESLFLNGEDNYTLRHILKNDWDLMLRDSSPTGIDLNHLLDRVHHIIRKNETLKRQKPLQKFIRIYMRAAAILLLPLLIAGGLVYSYLGYHGKTTTDRQVSSMIYAPLGARVSFNLPDGTSGMLNSGSHLSYSLPFADDLKIKSEDVHRFLCLTSPIRCKITPRELMTEGSFKKEEGSIYKDKLITVP